MSSSNSDSNKNHHNEEQDMHNEEEIQEENENEENEEEINLDSEQDVEDEEEQNDGNDAIGERAEAKYDGQNEDNGGDALSKMTPAQRRLMQLRMKMSSARRDNMEQVFHEKRSLKRMQAQQRKGQRQWKTRRELREEALDVNVTAETADRINWRRKQKEQKVPEGHDLFTEDALYRSMEKRVTEAPSSAFRKKRKIVHEDEDIDQLAFGQSEGPGDVDRMVAELHKQEKKRENFHRRRTFIEDKDVDYINERNRRTNLRLEKDYGKYTKEIKKNLERGTA